MANVSYAHGTMTLKGAWTPALIKKLNLIAAENWAEWYYCIKIVPFDSNASPEKRAALFDGDGRWAFRAN